MRKWFLWVAVVLAPLPAMSHIGPKEVQSIERPENRVGEQWIVVNNLGLFKRGPSQTDWVCDEAMTPFPGLTAVVPMGPLGETWLVGTRSGLRRSLDDGCSFLDPEPPLDTHVVADISAHPERSREALLSTQTLGSSNDLYLTEDSGQTWSALGLEIEGRIRAFLRAPTAPERVYLVHAGGALSSRDGGRSFTPFSLGPPELEIRGTEFDLLAIHPNNPEVLFAAYATFPESQLLRSDDGGETWASLLTLPDIPDSIAIDRQGETLLLATPVMGLLRSSDNGSTWDMLDPPIERGSIGCLTFDEDNTLLSCGQGSETALILHSEDLGLTWSILIDLNLSGVVRQTGCGAESDTIEQCNYTCDEFPAICPTTDGGTNESMGSDAGAAPTPATGSHSAGGEGGCAQVDTARPPMMVWCILVLLMMPLGRRRPSPRMHRRPHELE